MERSDFLYRSSFIYEIFDGVFTLTKKANAFWQNKYIIERVEFYLKEISKDGIKKLIEKGFLKNTGKGFINPKKNQSVGYYKTCGGHRYIEDFYSDMADKLN